MKVLILFVGWCILLLLWWPLALLALFLFPVVWLLSLPLRLIGITTGALNTLLLVGSTQALVGTPYGRLLGLKILLFLAMVAVALFNRFRLLPRLRRDTRTSAATAALARSVLCEQGLGFAVLAVVSVLGTWPPAIHPGGHQSGGADLVIAHHPVDRE